MRSWKQRLVATAILSFAALPLLQCIHLDYLHTGLAGKNLLQKLAFGDHSLELQQLEKVTLKGFSVGDFSHPLVQKQLHQYQRHGKKTLEAIMAQGAFYLPTIKRIFKKQGIPEELAYLPVIESGYRNHATSSAAAVGMWQFTYDTGIMYKLSANYWYDERIDFYKSTRAAAYHLKYLYSVFDDWLLVLAAYNAGAGKIGRAIKRYQTRNFWELIEYSYIKGETANYVPKYIAVLTMLKNPKRYNIKLPAATPEVAVKEVHIDDATAISVLTQCANMPVELFRRYNPSLLRWSTPPKRAYTIYVPLAHYQQFLSELNKLPPTERVTFREYFINIGDSLSTIASRFDLPVNPIAELNELSSLNEIRAGELLILPIQGKTTAMRVDAALNTTANHARVALTRQNNHTRIGRRTQKRQRQKLSIPIVSSADQATIPPYIFLHLLTPDDTLYALARRYSVGIGELMQWNGITGSRTLQPGKHLLVKLKHPLQVAE